MYALAAQAYAAAHSAVTLVTGLFNFVVSVTMSHVGRAVGERRWPVGSQKGAPAPIKSYCMRFLKKVRKNIS